MSETTEPLAPATDQIRARVTKVVIEKLSVKEEEVTDEAIITEDLGADSLDQVELVMAFEDEFDIEIPDEETADIKTIGDVVTAIKKKLGES